MSKLDIQGKLKINSSGILQLNGNPYVDFNAAGQLALGNQDWLPLCGETTYLSQPGSAHADAQGTVSSVSFDYNAGGMKFVGQGTVHIQSRIPVDKFSKYRIKIRVKKTVQAQNTITTPQAHTDRDYFYCGVSNFDSDHVNKFTDSATTYNYGVALAQNLSTDGTTTTGTSSHPGNATTGNSDGEYVFENTISGFNLANEGDHTKFDPGTSYFNIVIICNYIGFGSGNSDLVEAIKGETIIQNVEVERISSWGGNSSDSPADTALYFSDPSQNYYPGSMPTDWGGGWDGLVQMVGRGEWDENALSGSGDGRGWAFWPASGEGSPTLFIQEQKSKTAAELGKPANMNIGTTETGSKLISSWHLPLRVIGSYAAGGLLIGNNHPVARFEQHYQIPGRVDSSGNQGTNGDYLDINIVGYDNAGTNDFSGMAIESGWGNLYFGARNIMKMSDGGTQFDPGVSSSSALSGRHEWGMVIDQKNLVHIGTEGPALNEVGLYYTHGKEALNLHGAVKFSSITGPKAGSGAEGKGTLWWRDDTGPGAFYYRAPDGTDKVLGSGDVTFNYSGTLWEGYNADRIGTDNTVHFSKTSLNQLDLNPQYYQSTSTSGMALGCGWGQSDGMNRPAIQMASAANSGWSAIYLNKVGVTGPEQSGNDTRWIQFAVNGQNDTSFRSSGSDGRDFQIITGKQISLTAADGVAISDEEHPKQAYAILDVEGSNGDQGGQLYVSSTADPAENNGGGILFGAKVAASNRALTAGIHGVKSNGTDGDYKGDLIFTTRSGLTGTTSSLFQSGSIMPERMRITSDGYVGIGTSSPAAHLHVTGQGYFSRNNPVSAPLYAKQEGSGPSAYFMGGNVGVGTTSPSANLEVRSSAAGETASFLLDEGGGNTGGIEISTNTASTYRVNITHDDTGFVFSNNATVSRPYVFLDGDVGIGTASPSAPLEISTTSDEAIRINQGAGAPWNYLSFYQEDQFKGFVGTVGSDDSDLDGGLTLTALDGENLYLRTAAGSGANTDNRITVLNSNGNVGIGYFTSSAPPTRTLDVNGDINFSGNIYQNGSAVSFDTAAGGGSGSLWSSSGSDLYYDAGSVGIGTTSPEEPLDVRGVIKTKNDNDDSEVKLVSSGGMPHINFQRDTSANWKITSKGNGSKQVLVTSIDTSDLMTVQGDGNVGIGTTTPDCNLHIAGGTPEMKLEGSQPRIFLTETDQTDLNNLIRNNNSVFQIDTVDDDNSFIANRFSINNTSGNVGIGTQDPQHKLDVRGNARIGNGDDTTPNQQGTNSQLQINGSGYSGFLSLDTDAMWVGHNSNIRDLYLTTNVTPCMTIKPDGNVGIGTTSPAANLEIFSAVKPIIRLTGTGNNTLNTNFGEIQFYNRDESGDGPNVAASIHAQSHSSTGSGGSLVFSTEFGDAGVEGQSAEPRMTILSNGNVGIGTTSPSAILEVSRLDQSETEPALKVVRGDTSIDHRPTAPIFNVFNGSAGGAEVFRVRGDGNVGIGTTSPDCNLHIKGSDSADGGETKVCLESADGSQNAAIAHVDEDGAERLSIRVGGHSATVDKMTILNGGNVGIGTSSPDFKLTIDNGIGNEGLKVIAGNNGNSSESIFEAWNNKVNGSAPELLFKVRGDGNVGIGTTNPDTTLDINQPKNDSNGNALNKDVIMSFSKGETGEARIGLSGASSQVLLGSVADDLCIRSDGNNIRFGTASATRTDMTIDSTGSVGIGTTSPNSKLHVYGPTLLESSSASLSVNTNGQIEIKGVVVVDDDGGDKGIWFGDLGESQAKGYIGGGVYAVNDLSANDFGISSSAGNNLAFGIGGTEIMRIKSDGSVGIGTTDPQEKFHVHGTMMLSDTPAPATTTNKLYANAGKLYWNGSELTGGGTGGGSSIWTENYKTAEYRFPGWDALGTDTGKVRISGKDGQPGSCVRFESYIQNGASYKFAELGVTVPSGTTTADHAGYVLMSSRDASMYRIWFSNVGDLRTSSNATHIGAASGTVVGDQSSDERLKDIKPDFGYGLEQVMQLAPIEYSFKSDSEAKNRLGFGAQSTQSIIPEAVYDTDECLDGYEPTSNTDEEPQPKSDETKLAMQYVQLVPVLTKAIQELKAENDDLKARLESIEEWRGNSV